MAFSVKGKSAIVTGAGSGISVTGLNYLFSLLTWTGINFSFAKLLLENDCNVLIADLVLRPEAQALVDKYSAKTGSAPRAVFQKTDVADWTQLEKMFEVAVKEFGEIDVVCPGAGIYEPVSILLLHNVTIIITNDTDNNSFQYDRIGVISGDLLDHPKAETHRPALDMPCSISI